ncbi:AzlC family ABC transporter permease [Williamsia sp. MIQD14]|uniref:AzlC family ABC transporter permease n=1 Tax=Williamsia sp. MIQD14 TaxID=3425703 RepID=UPI003D9FFFA3
MTVLDRPLTRRATETDIVAGVRTVAPAAVSVLPMGLAFGVVVSQSVLAWWWAPVFAGVIFAGSLEILLVGMVSAMVPLAQIAVAALLVNMRHTFYSLSFPLHRVHGLAAKTYSTFALTDEAWALTSEPEAQTWGRGRILTVQSVFHLAWVGSVTVGAALGSVVPASIVGLEFAAPAFFVVLAMEAHRTRRRLALPALGVGCAVAAYTVLGGGMLIAAMSAYVGIVVAGGVLARRRTPASPLRPGERSPVSDEVHR